MASLGGNSTNGQPLIVRTDTAAKPQTEPQRSFANFPPSIWGNRFISFSLDHSALESYARSMEELTEEVRRLIVNPTTDSTEKLKIIYSVDRLGLSYLFADEIENLLDRLFRELNLHDYEDVDLHTISVHFQVFRDHGYKLSCDVFNKFKDNTTGRFQEYITSDVMGMLGLYECTPLRIRGEDILEEALAFTETRLKNIAPDLEGNLARQVKQALKRPFHLGMPLAEARLYVSTYEEESGRNESLLNLAKVHLNYLQLLHKEELRVVSKWWNDLNFQLTLPYVRDRATESYFWAFGIYFEPCYSYGRIIAAKTIMLIQVLDDTSDAYSTIEEMRLLTDAINRWEYSAVDQLPDYIKPFYKVLLNLHDELEKQQAKEGRAYSVEAWKGAFQELAGGYLQEAEWVHSGKVPSFPDYLKNGSVTSTYNLILQASLVGMGSIANEQVFAWYEARPKFLQATEVPARLINDLRTFQFERKRGQSAAGVDAYMKEYSVSEEVAIQEIDILIQNGFKDVNEGCLKPTPLPMPLLAPVRNLTKMLDVAYRFDDGYTFPEKNLHELITLLFVTPAPSLTSC